MSLRSNIEELTVLKIEKKNLAEKTKKINTRIKELETNISSSIEENNQIGVKCNDVAILIKETTKNSRKTIGEKDSDSINILEQYGIKNPEKVLKKILDSRKGEEVVSKKLVIEKIK